MYRFKSISHHLVVCISFVYFFNTPNFLIVIDRAPFLVSFVYKC